MDELERIYCYLNYFFCCMKHAYRLLALAGFVALSCSAAQAQNWRPFRPGLIYAFSNSTVNATYTLRLDSAYVASNDSVYAFNRIMRPMTANSSSFRASRNNVAGARLIVRPAQREYVLETLAEANLPAQSLVLRPQAAVGSSWAATATLTATLSARTQRTWGVAPGQVTDSVATITLSNGRIIELSRQNGLVRIPSNLPGSTVADLMAGGAPAPYAASIYSPLKLMDFQPGDELGYANEDYNVFKCYDNYELRRILSRQQTADSLIITYQTQTRQIRYGGPNYPCGSTASNNLTTPAVRRLAMPLRRPTWPSTAAAPQTADLALLTYEYAPLFSNSGFVMGEPIRNGSGACQLNGRLLVSYTRVYPTGPAGSYTYHLAVDAASGTHEYAAGIGETRNYDWLLKYYRKQLPNGTYATCGSNANYTTLLPTRTAQAAARFELFPNPAAQEATLRLLTPAPAGTHLTLHDATGRRVGQQEVSRGSSSVTVPLTALPAGVYVVQLHLPGEAPVALRLQHLP